MRLSEFQYQRPDLAKYKHELQQLIQQLHSATAAAVAEQLIGEISHLRNGYDSQATVARIRFTANTVDEFYVAENDFYDQASPEIDNLIMNYYRTLIGLSCRAELEQKLGRQLFTIAECGVKTISEQVIADLQLENKLITEYTKLIAGAKIDYRGQVYNLSGLITLQMSTNRETRKEVDQLRAQFFLEQSTQLDRIYDDLVQVRAQIAHKLGYQNFVQLGYDRMYRKDYGPIDIANYRQAISEQVVPLATELRLAQSKRIGTPELYYYDESVYFVHGNPKPTGSITQILEAASQMYSELSAETGKFFEFMSSNELLDLLNRPNKRGGGYCTFIPQLKAPFIFANFNGTEGDITVLTHEAGHAFQAYMSRDTDLPEYVFPTYEAAEIHSMSMEFLTWPWMDLFFGDQTRDFKYMHLTKALLFLPYGAAVDEFQHQVYEQPQLTALARKQLWRDLEHKYLPHRQYGANEFLASGGLWQSQSHIFQSPFYYIDYTLAQICALQFWSKAQTAPKQAWQDYLALCRVGGSKSFSELIAITGLESPFSHASIANVLLTTQNWIDSSLIN